MFTITVCDMLQVLTRLWLILVISALCLDLLCEMQVSMEYSQSVGRLRLYKFFIFLNSSVRGPFFPSYMPAGWQWPDAFVDRLSAEVKIVSSSLVCLPAIDAGGHGPKVTASTHVPDVSHVCLLLGVEAVTPRFLLGITGGVMGVWS